MGKNLYDVTVIWKGRADPVQVTVLSEHDTPNELALALLDASATGRAILDAPQGCVAIDLSEALTVAVGYAAGVGRLG